MAKEDSLMHQMSLQETNHQLDKLRDKAKQEKQQMQIQLDSIRSEHEAI